MQSNLSVLLSMLSFAENTLFKFYLQEKFHTYLHIFIIESSTIKIICFW